MILSSTTRRRAVLRPNRRVTSRKRGGGNRQLLEVKARSRTVTRQRTLAAIWISVRLAAVFLVGGGLWVGGKKAVDALFLENPDYVIRRIDVATDGTLTPEQVVAAAGIEEGAGIFEVSLTAVRSRLEELPQIRSAEVERALPDRVTIRVAERHPVAWLVPPTEGDPYRAPGALLVDADGVLIRPLQVAPSHLHLPVITGVQTDRLRAGEPVLERDVRAALELLRVTESRLLQARWEIRSIDLSKGYCMEVTDSRKGRITFPTADVERQVGRLEALLGWCEGNGRELLTANLVPVRNVPVTFVPTPEEEAAAALPAAPAAEVPVKRATPVRPATPVKKPRTRANG